MGTAGLAVDDSIDVAGLGHWYENVDDDGTAASVSRYEHLLRAVVQLTHAGRDSSHFT